MKFAKSTHENKTALSPFYHKNIFDFMRQNRLPMLHDYLLVSLKHKSETFYTFQKERIKHVE